MTYGINQISGGSESARWAQANSNFARLDREVVTKAFGGPNNTDSMVIGQLPDDLGIGIVINDSNGLPLIYISNAGGDAVMKVAKHGFDATVADDSNLVFNSAQNVFKIVQTGTYSLTKPAGQASHEESVAHGLTFIPMLFVNIEAVTTSPGEWRQGVVSNHSLTTGVLNAVGTAEVDATYIKFKSNTPSDNAYFGTQLVYNYKYYLLQETSN